MKLFLPDDEQRFYDSVVHGLRSQGWSRIDAEGEAVDRLINYRIAKYRDDGTPANPKR